MFMDSLKAFSLLCHFITGMFQCLFVIVNSSCFACLYRLQIWAGPIQNKSHLNYYFVEDFDIFKMLQVNENGVVLQRIVTCCFWVVFFFLSSVFLSPVLVLLEWKNHTSFVGFIFLTLCSCCCRSLNLHFSFAIHVSYKWFFLPFFMLKVVSV